MRIAILFVLLACLAVSLVSASKESSHQPGQRQPPRKAVGQTAETPKRVKRQVVVYPYRRPYYTRYGYPGYWYI